jgi:hypothetical protein
VSWAAWAAAQQLAVQQNESLPITGRTLGKRLHEAKLLVSTDPNRNRLAVRHTVEGKRLEVWHLSAAMFLGAPVGPQKPSQTSQPAQP